MSSFTEQYDPKRVDFFCRRNDEWISAMVKRHGLIRVAQKRHIALREELEDISGVVDSPPEIGRFGTDS